MNQILGFDWLPKRARWSYLARSGLPAASRKKHFPESHVINSSLTKLVRSRWLDIGLILFFASLWTSTSSRFINTQKKNLANIQPSWRHTWSITRTYFLFQVVAATNRVDILDPALLRSGLNSIIISLFRFSIFPVPEKYIQGNLWLELFPWITILMMAPAYQSCRAQFYTRP